MVIVYHVIRRMAVSNATTRSVQDVELGISSPYSSAYPVLIAILCSVLVTHISWDGSV